MVMWRRYALAHSVSLALTAAACTPSASGDAVGNCRVWPGNLSVIEREVVSELNLARTQPPAYARQVARWNPGTLAHAEAVEYLNSVSPLPPLRVSECLNRSARDHVRDTGPVGQLGHAGTDGSNVGMRVARYVHGRATAWGENISYGSTDGRAIVVGQIVDINVLDRGHRENIFNALYTHVGVAYGPHKSYGTMCVIDFARLP